ncbi:gene transfer agent family protein [Wenxinia saemankumensis]|uniref:Phage tail tube protein, GTA-gp10 n=1 Tax=Wenxinia saemankumensis TaxID=1447782 RepID=A0A1M6GMR9_9RHOB|nr:gene transfer agent family protein [Wenxinia saemankumensis]SHJ11211.1 Phage tail tube protein, GTA-gp10 [Wenxinia saemankumensis]
MGANPQAGEVALSLGGRSHVCKLTLGTLAELEAELGEDSLVALVERFETGRFRAADVIAVLEAGLRGGGWRGTRADLVAGDPAGGPVGAARAAAALIARAFAVPE